MCRNGCPWLGIEYSGEFLIFIFLAVLQGRWDFSYPIGMGSTSSIGSMES